MKKNVNVLIRVDCQYDFMPGGSLAVKNGDKIIKPLNKINGLFDYVVDTMDWHPANHRCFSEFNSGVKIGEKVKRNDVDNGEITVWPAHCNKCKMVVVHGDTEFKIDGRTKKVEEVIDLDVPKKEDI